MTSKEESIEELCTALAGCFSEDHALHYAHVLRGDLKKYGFNQDLHYLKGPKDRVFVLTSDYKTKELEGLVSLSEDMKSRGKLDNYIFLVDKDILFKKPSQFLLDEYQQDPSKRNIEIFAPTEIASYLKKYGINYFDPKSHLITSCEITGAGVPEDLLDDMHKKYAFNNCYTFSEQKTHIKKISIAENTLFS